MQFRASEIQNAATKPCNLDSKSLLSSCIFATGNRMWKKKIKKHVYDR